MEPENSKAISTDETSTSTHSLTCDAGQGNEEILRPWKLSTWTPLTIVQATNVLRRGEARFHSTIGDAELDVQTDTITLESSLPNEDNFSHGEIDVGDERKWLYWGVYDGHGGWATSKTLSKILAPWVANGLRRLPKPDLRDSRAISSAIESAFVSLDNELLGDAQTAMDGTISHAEAMCRIAPADAGSCATLILLDSVSLTLHVACVGDSRAVLGRRSEGTEGEYSTAALSIDQNGSTESEVDRIMKEHPGETPIESGRLLECAVTRGFGDLRWKLPIDQIQRWRDHYFGQDTLSGYHTPPYMIANPVVETSKISQGDFVILASDGFWNHFTSNEDAIHCMKLWLDARRTSKLTETSGSNTMAAADETQTQPAPYGYPWNWKTPCSHYVVEDTNAATHLAKNALGGPWRELFCSAMSTLPQASKEVRDDITVIVIFLGSSEAKDNSPGNPRAEL